MMDRASASQHLPLFSTPLSMYEIAGMEDINRDLTARLVAESAAVPSITAATSADGIRVPIWPCALNPVSVP